MLQVTTNSGRAPLVIEYNPIAALPEALIQTGANRPHTPWSDRFFAALKPLVGDLALDDDAYSRAFDRMEYVLALMYWSHRPGWAPIGRHAWRWSRHEEDDLASSVDHFTSELLSRGLFGGEREQLEAAVVGYDMWMVRSGARWP
jgi:hypothetical protein